MYPVGAEGQGIGDGLAVADVSEGLLVNVNSKSGGGSPEVAHAVHAYLALLGNKLRAAFALHGAVDVLNLSALRAFYSESSVHKSISFQG